MVRRGQRQPGAVIISAGRAPRIASASIPARVLAAGDVRSVPGTGELDAGLDDVLQARAGLPSASPVSRRRSRGCWCGPAGGAAACPQAGLRAAGHQGYRHLRDVRCGRHRCRPIAPGYL